MLDVGCGPGYCAGELAELVGAKGQVVGVDIAPAMIALARQAPGSSPSNVSFRVADAQTDVLGSGTFDAVYARFSLFFDEMVAGLLNIRSALRPRGRFACLAWGPPQDNPWQYVPRLAASRVLGVQAPEVTSGQDRCEAAEELTRSLSDAGFVNVAVEVILGARHISQATASNDLVTLFDEGGSPREVWRQGDSATREACCRAAMDAMAPYRTERGWSLPGCALLGTATQPA